MTLHGTPVRSSKRAVSLSLIHISPDTEKPADPVPHINPRQQPAVAQ